VKRVIEAENRGALSPDPLARAGSHHGTTLKTTLLALAALLIVGSNDAAFAGPVEQRASCRAEARQRVARPRHVDLDLYGRVLERRRLYVEQCMASRLRSPDETGAAGEPSSPASSRAIRAGLSRRASLRSRSI
jgi:hypothetical protein